MGFGSWFIAQVHDIEAAQADADHMRDKYGGEAAEMCSYAIKGTPDEVLRQKLKRVHLILAAEDRSWRRSGRTRSDGAGQNS